MVFSEKIEDGTLTQTEERKHRPYLEAMKTHYKQKFVCNVQFIEILAMHSYIYIYIYIPK
jgi:hypothetical protein